MQTYTFNQHVARRMVQIVYKRYESITIDDRIKWLRMRLDAFKSRVPNADHETIRKLAVQRFRETERKIRKEKRIVFFP